MRACFPLPSDVWLNWFGDIIALWARLDKGMRGMYNRKRFIKAYRFYVNSDDNSRRVFDYFKQKSSCTIFIGRKVFYDERKI